MAMDTSVFNAGGGTIVITGKGEIDPSLTRLEKELTKLGDRLTKLKAATWEYGEAQQIVAAQTRNEVQALKNSNVMLKARSNISNRQLRDLAVEQRAQKQYTEAFENRMATEQRALQIQHDSKVNISNADARIMAERQLREEADARAFEAVQRRKQQALMRTSISMFVMNISASQLVSAMKPLVEGHEEAEQAIKDVQGALQLSLAPLQTYMALQMIQKNLTTAQTVAMMKFASSMGAVFFWYQAIKAQSPGVRAAYFAIAAALTAVAIASWGAATGIGVLKTAWYDWSTMAALVIASATLMGVIGAITAPKGQTLTGHRKRVRKGGTAILDDDEVITREPKGAGTRGEGGGDIHIYMAEGYNGSMADAKITANTVNRLVKSGYGNVKYKRRATGA